MRAPARLLVRLTARPEHRDAMVGDLEEGWAERRATGGRARATLWYWRQALGSAGPNLWNRARRFGRRVRERRGGGGDVRTLMQDVRYGLRTIRRAPFFAAALVGTLALGIGANTTVFSVVDALILNPFPFPEADRVVGVGTAYPRLGEDMGFWENLSTHEYADVAEEASTLEDVVAWDMGNRVIDGEGPPQNVFSAFWWGDPLRTVQMRPHLGRSFTDEEVRTGAPSVMLSHRIWVERFGADSSMVGEVVRVNGDPYTLVGIVPEGVSIYGTDLWMTMPVSPLELPRNRRQYQVLARIAEDADLAAVNAELEGLARRTEREHAAEFEEYAGWRMEARPWARVTAANFATPGFVLMGAVGFVLLLVCSNVASLLLARSGRRREEMAVRRSLGAGGGRLVRQLLTESVVLALLGGVGALAVAWLGVRAFQAFLAGLGVLNTLPAGALALDGRVLLFTAAVALGAGVLFGLVPALQSLRGPAGALPGRSSAGGDRPVRRLQKVFVGVEVALALALLTGGGLLIRTLVEVNRVEPGFTADEVLSMRLTLPWQRYDAEGIRVFFQELTERTEALPGVRSAAATTQYPPISFAYRELALEGMPPDPEGSLPTALTTVVTPGYFETMGIPLLRGRAISSEDRTGSSPVVVVNETLARTFFPDQDPVGQRVRLAGQENAPWFTVVGVVRDVRNAGLQSPVQPELYAAQEQAGGGNQLFLLVRVDGDPYAALPEVRGVVQAMDPDQPVYAVQTLAEALDEDTAPQRATTTLLLVFGLFALFLAASGVYAVVAYSVGERTREIGLRMALGAEPGRVRSLVVRQALVPVLVGALLGVPLALLVGRSMSGILFEVGAADPWTLAGVGTLLVAAATLASWIPARRASRLDPKSALRVE